MGTWFTGLLESARLRALDRIAAAYAVGAWLFVQAASIALPAFDAPGWLLRWLIVALVVGFPAVLICVWIVRKPEAEVWQLSHFRARDAVFASVVVLIAALTLGELAWHWSSQGPPAENATTAPAGSIAVLPFDNMSGDPKQKYFSEGMSAELINLLARNPGLRVAARTSSFYFEGKSLDIRTVAQKLNVRAVLEGSVSTNGTHIHIDTELVNAANGFQMWSQSYDRPLSDILALQSDIAGAIAQALTPALTGVKQIVPKPISIDPQVYRDYLQAQILFDQRLTEGQTPQSQAASSMALQLFRKVATQAPDFADGQAAFAYALLYSETGNELQQQITGALQRALAIDPQNPVALAVAADNAGADSDWDDLIRYSVRLKKMDAHSAFSMHMLAVAYENLGLTSAATAEFQKETQLDPFSYPAWGGVVRTYFEQALYHEAIAASAKALALHPDDPVVHEYDCVSLASLNRIPEAKNVLDFLSQPGIPKPLSFHCKFFVTLHSEGAPAAIAWVKNGLAKNPADTGGPGDTGFMLSHAPGAFDAAVKSYNTAMDVGGFGFFFYPGKSPPPAFFQNPGWIALTQRPEYRRWQAAHDRAKRELLGDNP